MLPNAKEIARGQRYTIILDGDELREVWPGLGLEEKDRRENCLRAARLARRLEDQGMTIIVAMIAPYEDLRREIFTICGCHFIYMSDGVADSFDTPYEEPSNPLLVIGKEDATTSTCRHKST